MKKASRKKQKEYYKRIFQCRGCKKLTHGLDILYSRHDYGCAFCGRSYNQFYPEMAIKFKDNKNEN